MKWPWKSVCHFVCGTAILFAALAGYAQTPVTIDVDLSQVKGPYTPIYSWFGYDEPNYTYTAQGRELLNKLQELSPVPVHIRVHNLFTTGDGQPELKWGSTNVYTLDAQGDPVYNWTILDKIFDGYAAAHVRPMIELGFMPEAMSTHPQPYHVQFPKKIFEGGWSYPPQDYQRWEELVKQFAQHLVRRYGRSQVEKWYWEVWNEPDIGYWKGTPADYARLYDFSVAGVRQVLPQAKVGGPATTGPDSAHAGEYLRQFLEHCANGKSAAGGGSVPLSFVSFHVKGHTAFVDGHVQMGLNRQLQDAAHGFAIISKFPRFRSLPVILSEADPEGCAACSSGTHPENGYRNGTLYPTYTAAAMKALFELSDRYRVHLIGMLTWAFEYENEPYFAGFRTLTTHGVDKPELNIFRMAGLISGQRAAVTSTGAVPLDAILRSGVRETSDVDALATTAPHRASVMAWNYQDSGQPGAVRNVVVRLRHLPPDAKRVLLLEYRIDKNHSNSFEVWKEMGSPQNPTPFQAARLKAAGQLEMLDSPQWLVADHGQLTVTIELPSEAVSLLQFSWQR